VVVSHRTTEALLANVPSVRSDKKALKPALKYRQMVTFYSTVDGGLLGSVPEVYDIIRALAFSTDGTRLLVYSSTDPRAQGAGAGALSFNGAARPGRVEQVDARDRTPLRAAFWSRMNEPFLSISPDGSAIALSSTGGKNQRQLTLYDFASADTQVMIDLAQKHKYDVAEGEEHDGRLAYSWLSDGRMILALGSNLGIYTP
jgi:Tol biopolymer transport system component